MLTPWIGKAVFLVGLVVLIVIRNPYEKLSRRTRIAESRKSIAERLLLPLMGIGGFVVPAIYFVSPILNFADYPLRRLPFLAGLVCLAFSFWLFYRSHADLGANWSNSLELRENHGLVASGVYSSIRHPMYVAGLLFGLAAALLLPNWVAGPAFLVALSVMVVFRIRPEEQMLIDRFGRRYLDYMQRTRRFIPGVW